MITTRNIEDYYAKLNEAMLGVEATNSSGELCDIGETYTLITNQFRQCHRSGGTVFFIGNGGSAAISSHMAEDYTKNGNIKSMTFNDAALITCFANDYGYDRLFSEAIKKYARSSDILVAISSSGKSPNILNAITAANNKSMRTITLSGFEKDNPLRISAHINFYVPAKSYGVVEIAHLAILHSILDMMELV